MKVSKNCIDLIRHYEGCRLQAYQDAVGVWTIGWGNTRYQNNEPVKQGDTITQAQADFLNEEIIEKFAEDVDAAVTSAINQNQFDALVSFTYNLGIGNLKKSTLLKKVNLNPCDGSIAYEFAKWNKAGGHILNGLVKRRQAESDLYFKTAK